MKFHKKISQCFTGLWEKEADAFLLKSWDGNGKDNTAAIAAGTACWQWQSLLHMTWPSLCGNHSRSRCTCRVRGRDQLLWKYMFPSFQGKQRKQGDSWQSALLSSWMLLCTHKANCEFQKHSDVFAKNICNKSASIGTSFKQTIHLRWTNKLERIF